MRSGEPKDQALLEYAALVRRAREESGLSLTQVAERSGLSRTTLYRWEHGHFFPWLPELERFLDATKPRTDLVEGLTRGVNRPRSLHKTRIPASQQLGLNSLLQAIRLRSGKSTAEIASLVGVSASAVRQWERGDGWPTPENLHRLCFHSGATPEELSALVSGPLVSMSASMSLLETVEQRLAARQNPLPAFAEDPLMDLKVAYLESRLTELIHASSRPDRYQITLGHVRASYAQALQIWGRHGQALRVAKRAIDQTRPRGFSESLVRAHVVFAQVQTELKRAPIRQVQVLLDLEVDVARQRPGGYYSFQPWIWATIADLLAQSRRVKASIDAIDRAAEIERTHHGRPSSEVVRWKAKLLNNLGKPQEAERTALKGISEAAGSSTEPPVPGLWLELATARERMGRREDATDALVTARDLAVRNSIDFLIPVIANRLS